MVNKEKIWEDYYGNFEGSAYPHEELIRFIAKHYYRYKPKKRQEIKMLELGCGGGCNLWYLAREGFDVYGVEISKKAVGIARRRLKKENLKAYLQSADFTVDLDFSDNFFDCVIDNLSLCFNREGAIISCLKNVHRVLKNKGRIFSMTISDRSNMFNLSSRLEKNTYRNISETSETKSRTNTYDSITTMFNRRYIRFLYKEANLKVCEINYCKWSVDNSKKFQEFLLTEAIKE